MDKKNLSILLSQLKTFNKPKYNLEQYQTDAEITADILWNAFMNNDIKGKVIADLGCGNGIFGIGALILNAKKVFFLDIDENNISLAKDNLTTIEKKTNFDSDAKFINKNVKSFKTKVDVVIENPPFGVKNIHQDKMFLKQAFNVAKVIYSIHKIESKNFIDLFSKDSGFQSKLITTYKLPLKKTLFYHILPKYYVEVGCWRFNKK